MSYLTTSLAARRAARRSPPPAAATADHAVAFIEFARRHGDFALVASRPSLELDDAGSAGPRAWRCRRRARPRPRAAHAERFLTGQALADAVVREAARAAPQEIDPADDLHATAHYRRRLAAALVEDAARAAARPRKDRDAGEVRVRSR